MISILEADGDKHWSAWMGQVKYRIEDSDFSGIELLRSAYGLSSEIKRSYETNI